MPTDPVAALLSSHRGLAEIAADPERYRLQVVLGVVEERDGRPVLVQHGYRLGAEYFYPASAVKLFAAVAALERLGALARETGLPLDADTPLVYHPLFPDEALEADDPSHLGGGRITVGHEIRKLFLVSDNQAFNRLYELVGQDGLAASLARAGLDGARIVHRLEEARTPEENRRSPRIDFLAADGGVLHTVERREAPPLPPAPPEAGLGVGRAHLAGGERVEEPFDFTEKNRVSLAELQRGLCMVVRPDADCGGPGFRLTAADRALLLDAMTTYPADSPDPRYDRAAYPDAYAKYLLPGLARVIPKERLRIANKIGQAYGFTTENAWITDTATGRSLLVAATLYTNEDETLNDDRYEYEEIALPFLADLGEAVGRLLNTQAPEP
ncbi:MAG TPA: serine hydrolase [Thermoanaerobaculia bacterium]|nr:serine hydrolase [Thermoanaerobaculia bacterium]